MAATWLASFRRFLAQHPRFARLVRAVRALIHFGPWRHAARALIRAARPPAVQVARAAPLLACDAALAAARLRSDSVYVAGQLPPHLLADLRAITDQLPVGDYGQFHEQNAEVNALAHDPGVLDVVRSYFGAEPVLLECGVVVHENEERFQRNSPQRYFHFDFAGWHSLNLFVYLTDVDEAGAHEVVCGTHRSKRFRDAIRPYIPNDEADRRFNGHVRRIAGPAGTCFFEDTEAFHRRQAVQERRVMLNVLFASHRGRLSHGRLSRPYAKYLAKVAGATRA
jgi:hypothetical protein